MDSFTAVGLAEGFLDPTKPNKEEQKAEILEAWQYLIDTGEVWQMQGWFGRTAQALLDRGLCRPAPSPAPSNPLEAKEG
jgi:hypothetical protein